MTTVRKREGQALGVGLLGLGVVGGGVATALLQKADQIRHRLGVPLVIRKALVRDPQKPRSAQVPPGLITTLPEQVLQDPDIAIVIEVLGGEHPAVELIVEALERGKHVVTANKEVMAKHGPRLLSLANRKGVQLLFEASVGGGVPIIGPLLKDLAANEVSAIHAIINGTTNYILTSMSQQGLPFATALRHAQELGYAEADPTNDIEGVDAAYKLAILSTLAFRTSVHPSQVYREGITRVEAKDFRYAQELGYTIKLLAIARKTDGAVQLRVHPAFVPQDHLLAKVDGVFNAVEVQGDLVGRVLFHGRGAGAEPTSSAIVADVMEIARNVLGGVSAPPFPDLGGETVIKPIEELVTGCYLRLVVEDTAGVLHQISGIFADLNISIASVIQKETDAVAGTAEIVVTTHPSREAAIQEALRRLETLRIVKRVGNCIRVEDLSA
ncbi:MAG: homoserine dehydrogenase [Dehalococcoidia bacterium]|nr:homoserine dehydrogenase [Dehalococcoidia bacterium]